MLYLVKEYQQQNVVILILRRFYQKHLLCLDGKDVYMRIL